MANVNLHTTLSITAQNNYNTITPTDRFILVTRGATATFTLDLTNKSYTFDNIESATFAFKQGRTSFGPYVYSVSNDASTDYSFIVPTDKKSITLKLEPSITKSFKSTESRNNYIIYEITVKLTSGTNDTYTLIEPQPKIAVRNSLYGDLI